MGNYDKKLDPVLKAKWLAALRSGNYTQGQNALIRIKESTREYCCLGVLCDVLVKDNYPGISLTNSAPHSTNVLTVQHTINILSAEHTSKNSELLPESLAAELFGDTDATNPNITLDVDDPLLFGWDTDNGRHPAVGGNMYHNTVSLAEMNDEIGDQLDFEEIARVIDRYL